MDDAYNVASIVEGGRRIITGPLFDPEDGVCLVAPPGNGQGYWAGAPGIFWDQDTGEFFLAYRLREPRGPEDRGRGYEVRVAESRDGVTFKDVFVISKQELNSPSLERAAIFKDAAGEYRLLFSYVDPSDRRWRIDAIGARHPSEFRLERREPAFTAPDAGAEGVKDPWIMNVNGTYYLYMSYAPRPDRAIDEPTMHAIADAFSTGYTRSLTGLATSRDGRRFEWAGISLGVGTTWDSYESRISSVVYVPPFFLAFYDGIASLERNYEEQSGLGASLTLRRFTRVTEEGPVLKSPHGSGSLRYVDVAVRDREWLFYFEYCRPDGSHELRMSRVDPRSLRLAELFTGGAGQ